MPNKSKLRLLGDSFLMTALSASIVFILIVLTWLTKGWFAIVVVFLLVWMGIFSSMLATEEMKNMNGKKI